MAVPSPSPCGFDSLGNWMHEGSGSRSARPVRHEGIPLPQNGNISFTARVSRADKIFIALFADFQIVGNAFAGRTMTQNRSIRWMINPKVFHRNPPVMMAARLAWASLSPDTLSTYRLNRKLTALRIPS